jgi:membrane-associated protein
VLARFIAVIRTFAPIVAGIGKMNYKTFIVFNVMGGALWSAAVPLAGYYLGKAIPNVDKYLIPIIIVIIIVSAIPTMINFMRSRNKKDLKIETKD